MGGVPPSASAHPATWKFDYRIYHPADLAAWHAWLAANHAAEPGVWMATFRDGDRPGVAYEDAVEEAICFGWIDSTVNVLDADRRLQLMTPRRPRSTWTRLNRRRVAELEEAGRMTDAGREAVRVARANGWWTILEPVEALEEPAALAAALDEDPAAREHWDDFPPSARKQMLWWVVSAMRDDTRDRRVAAIVAAAREGRRARG